MASAAQCLAMSVVLLLTLLLLVTAPFRPGLSFPCCTACKWLATRMTPLLPTTKLVLTFDVADNKTVFVAVEVVLWWDPHEITLHLQLRKNLGESHLKAIAKSGIEGLIAATSPWAVRTFFVKLTFQIRILIRLAGFPLTFFQIWLPC